MVLIAGGDGKGQDFSPLAPAVKARARAVVLIGRDAPAIEEALAEHGRAACERARRWKKPCASRATLAQPGDAVLLSPACASLDMFRNYGHRGDVFAAAVRALRRRPTARMMLYNPARRELDLDQALLWSALLLGAIGLVMVYSASIAMADAERFTGFRPGYFLVRHAVVPRASGVAARRGALPRAAVAVAEGRARGSS